VQLAVFVDRHRLDADLDPDPTFQFDADPLETKIQVLLNNIYSFPPKNKVYLYIWLNWMKILIRSGSETTGPGCRSRSGKMMPIRLDPHPRH
jgi:hypothetical protein